MNYPDYRSAASSIIGPILNYFGFYINDDGIIQKYNSSIGITLSGKHLYIPKDGQDYFASKDSNLLISFNPFKIREHTLILSKFLCSFLSNKFRDEDDEMEYNSDGELIDIVSLVKRGPKNEDNLPATFNGVIYEIWCRGGEEIFGRGIDPDGSDVKAILMAMIDTISKFSNNFDKNPNFIKIFKFIAKIESKKEEEADLAKSKYSSNLSQVDYSNDTMDNLEIVEESNDENKDDEDENDNIEQKQIVFANEVTFDDIDLF